MLFWFDVTEGKPLMCSSVKSSFSKYLPVTCMVFTLYTQTAPLKTEEDSSPGVTEWESVRVRQV